MVSSGGPITKDNTSVEYYCTIFAAGESPRIPGVLWTGSDDGLVHVSQDAGQNWSNVTPPNLPEWTMINSLEVDPHNDGGCYIAATRYKLGDYTPYLYHTKDYGTTWRRIDRGIPRDHFTRVIRVDEKEPNLLYAGTESGMYVSFNGGSNWQPLQQNLPVVPITDIALKNSDLVVATQGRALWVMDGAAEVLRELCGESKGVRLSVYNAGLQKDVVLLPVEDSYLTDPGVQVRFLLPDSLSAKQDTVRIAFAFADQLKPNDWALGVKNTTSVIRVFSTHPDKDAGEEQLEIKPGANAFNWNFRGADAEKFEGMILWWADMRGPRVPAGKYTTRIEINPDNANASGKGHVQRDFELKVDPRAPGGSEAMQERYRFHQSVIQTVSEAHKAIKEMRSLREQISGYTTRLDTTNAKYKPLLLLAEQMDSTITKVEKTLYQTQNRSGQDPLNFPIRLTNKLASLNSMTQGEFKPTDGAYQVQKDIEGRIRSSLESYYSMRDDNIKNFNELVQKLQVPALSIE